ncbi:MAG: hypothetical protein JWO30_1006 [Fibrobacteres bacterium]|nr:hypothetical protein [Fibrobacterota bacterium]
MEPGLMTDMEVQPSLGDGPRPDLSEYRESAREQERIRNLFHLLPGKGGSALDIGARDGYLSLRLTERYASVTALDLEKPEINHPNVACVQGDVVSIASEDGNFDLVLCSEVLEHIPPALLPKACAEISRVSRGHVLIGVPFNQDTRYARTTCPDCDGKNPPWGHVNSFDEKKLRSLFPGMRVQSIDYVGWNRERTNAFSAFLMDFAGNPFGTYNQEEGCIHCGSKLAPPEFRNPAQRLASFIGHMVMRVQSLLFPPQPNWIHILFSKI